MKASRGVMRRPNLLYIRVFVCALFCSLLGACASRQPHDRAGIEYNPQARLYVYECGDDFTFYARIEVEKAALLLPSLAVTLRQVSAASGAKYSDGHVTFWSKGKDAVLEVENKNYRACKNNPDKAVWALADSGKKISCL